MTAHPSPADHDEHEAVKPSKIGEAGSAEAGDAMPQARHAWLLRRVLDSVDTGSGGGYSWDPDTYAPIPIHEDGETGLIFAKT